MTPFGLTTGLLRQGKLGPRDVERLASVGFNSIELTVVPGHFSLDDADQVRGITSAVRDAGMTISAVSVTPESAKAALALVAALPAPVLVVRSGGCRRWPAGGPDTRRLIDHLIGAATAGTPRIAIEIPNEAWLGVDKVADLLEETNGRVGVCLDTGHAHLAGRASEAADDLGGLLLATHLHDNTGRDDAHRIPGSGSVDWPSVMASCWKAGYSGAWTFDLACEGDVDELLGRAVGARRRLQAILEDLAQPFAFEE